MENCLSPGKCEQSINTTHDPTEISDAVRSHDTSIPETNLHQLRTELEVEVMKGQLTPLSLDSCGDSVRELLAALHGHSWFGFDLDDTLHDFSKASKAAATEVLKDISSHSEISRTELAASYSEILAQKTTSAFTDGRMSDDYHKERFGALLENHGLATDESRLKFLAALLQNALASTLEPKPGALTPLPYLRSIGKKVGIITEGPQDAQEWTIEKLGLSEHLDELVTTNKYGKSKTDGLFASVLGHLGIHGEDMIYVGDNYARDIVPAQDQGITTIHFSEAEDEVLSPHGMRVNSLLKIESVLRLGKREAKTEET